MYRRGRIGILKITLTDNDGINANRVAMPKASNSNDVDSENPTVLHNNFRAPVCRRLRRPALLPRTYVRNGVAEILVDVPYTTENHASFR